MASRLREPVSHWLTAPDIGALLHRLRETPLLDVSDPEDRDVKPSGFWVLQHEPLFIEALQPLLQIVLAVDA